MTWVKLKGLKKYRNPKNGRLYCYHRKSGTRIKSEYGTAAFFAEFESLDRQWEKKSPPKAKPGSLGLIITEYKRAPAFERLAPRTKSDYHKVFDYLWALKEMPAVNIDRPFVAKLRDKTYRLRRRRFANYVLSVLSTVMKFALEYGYVSENTVLGVAKIRRPKDMPAANRPWQATERRNVIERAPWRLKIPIAVGMFTALRQADVMRLPKSAVKRGWLHARTGKTGEIVDMPVAPDLVAILEAAPRHDAITICANSRGIPYTLDGFRTEFSKLIRRLEGEGLVKPGLTFHGLRHTTATLLKESGHSDEDIALFLAQRSTAMARHYSKTADGRARMTAMVNDLDPLRNGNNQAQKLSNRGE